MRMTFYVPLLAIGGFLFQGAVSAQDSPALTSPTQAAQSNSATESNSAEPQSAQLQEITVTATRRKESIAKVPMSIAALSEHDLAAADIKGVTDLAQITPGLQFGTLAFASTLTEISIRGMNSLFGASTVGIYLDDVPLQGRLSSDGNVGNPYPVVFDLNRIEVLRGPQGTLFGAGSEAGTIRFITNQPSLTQFSGFSRAEVDATDGGNPSYEVGTAAGGPLIDNRVGFRASVDERQDGGYVDRVQPWNDQVVARDTNWDRTLTTHLALAVKPTASTLITPSILYQEVHTNDNGRFDPVFSDPSAGQFDSVTLLPEITTDKLFVPEIDVESHLSFADLSVMVSSERRTVDESEDLSGFVGALGLANYGNPLGSTYASAQSDVSPFFTGTSVHAFTEEVRLTSDRSGAFFTWVAGLFNDHRTQTDYQLQYSLLVDPTSHEIFDTLQSVKDEQVAAYAQGDFHLGRKWTVTLGDRVARVKSDQTNVNGTGVLDAVPPFAAASLTQTPTTPLMSISYQLNRNNMFYATASKGFRIGGGNDPLPAVCGYTAVPSAYKADYDWNYEVGAKDKLFDGRLDIDSSAFHVVWSNIQQLAQPACGISFTFNGGTAVSNGFDLAMRGLPMDHLELAVDVGYSDAHATSSVYDSHGELLVSKGDVLGYLPWVDSPWNVNAAANYGIPIFHGDKKLNIRLEYQYHSRNPGPFVNSNVTSPVYSPQQGIDPPTHLANARLGFTNGSWDFTLFVNNVFNTHPLLGTYAEAVVEAPTSGTFRPRTVGVSAELNY